MSRFEHVEDPCGDEVLSRAYSHALKLGWRSAKEGVPSGLVTTLAARPDLLEGLLQLVERVVGTGQIPPTVKSMIMMAIAHQSDCRYCAVAHTRALESMGVPGDVIQSCASDPEFAELPPSQRALVKFAVRAGQSPKAITSDEIEGLRDLGITDGEILELTFIAGLGKILDILAEVTEVEIDPAH